MTLNLEDVYMIERIGPSFSDFHFKIKFYGSTPRGKRLEVIVELPAWGVQELAPRLYEVQKEFERLVSNSREALEGK